MGVVQIAVLLVSVVVAIGAILFGARRPGVRPWLNLALALLFAVLANLGTYLLVVRGSALGVGCVLAAIGLMVLAFR